MLGSRLRSHRESKGMTQERLALDAGLDRSFLVDVEAGHHSLMLDRVFDLAHALGVSAADLVK
ncbi:MAG: helix-turn-helix transcriptional regulator [Actinomycetota bacterium]|nr:helix-turn-helix transcriptional regulator [Actinomycetota bacterium]